MSQVAARTTKVVRATNQSLADDTAAAISFSARVDLPQPNEESGLVLWEGVTHPSRVYVDTPGLYLLLGEAVYAADVDGIRHLYFRVNGGASGRYGHVEVLSNGAAETVPMTCQAVLQLARGDYVELWGHHTAGGALNVVADVTNNQTPSLTLVLLRSFYDASLAHEIG